MTDVIGTPISSGISNGYATLDDWKAWVSVRGLSGTVTTDTSDDDIISILIEAASRYMDIESGLRFYYNLVDETRYFTTDDTECVKVDDLVSITTISVDFMGQRVYTDLTASDYDKLPANAALKNEPYTRLQIRRWISGYFFPTTPLAVQIVGKFGYPAVPTDVKDATLAIVQSLNGACSGQTSQGKVTVTAAGIVIRSEDVPAFAQKVIDHYRERT